MRRRAWRLRRRFFAPRLTGAPAWYWYRFARCAPTALLPDGYAGSATPALSKLAKQGVVFENAYANSNWTAAAVASMLTGKRPFSHGLLSYMDSLSPDIPVIQSVLSENGYETAAFLAGLPAEAPYGLSRGFGHIHTLFEEELHAMSRLVPAAVEWEKSLSPEKDFFMFLHADDAHSPYRCSPGTYVKNGKFPEANSEFATYYNGFPGFDLHKLDLEKWKQALSYRGNTAFLSNLSNAYDRCVSRLDKDLAALLRKCNEITDSFHCFTGRIV